MRHAVKGKQLNRDVESRRSLFKNLMLSLIEHGHINTTEAKAKAIRSSFEKLMTKAKAGSLNDRRMIDRELNRRTAVNRLVDEIAPAVKRTSGFTRIVKLGERRGDDAHMARIEILDWQPKVAEPVKKETKKVKEEKKEVSKTAAPVAKAETRIRAPKAAEGKAMNVPQKRSTGGGK